MLPPVEVSPPFVFTEPPPEPSGVPASSECPNWTPSCEGTHLGHFCALSPFPGCLYRVGTQYRMKRERKEFSCFQRLLL